MPVETADKAVRILGPELSPASKHHLNRVAVDKTESNVRILNPDIVQLPIERMVPPALTLIGGTKYCAMCQYFLHFIQEEITSPKNEVSVDILYMEKKNKQNNVTIRLLPLFTCK